MDVEETKKFIQNKIEAESLTKQMRDKIKIYTWEKQNIRGFKETFKPLIKSQDKIKESIDNQQNAMIKQLQENQLALTQGFDENRLAITQGFDKMDEVRKWDLNQLPFYDEDKPGAEDDVIINTLPFPSSSPPLPSPSSPPESPSSSKEIKLEKFSENPPRFSFDKFDRKPSGEKLDLTPQGDIKFTIPSLFAKYKKIPEENYTLQEKINKFNSIKEELGKNLIVNKAYVTNKDGVDIAVAKSKNPRIDTKREISRYNKYSYYLHNLNLVRIYHKGKSGSGILHFNNPYQLLDRLELLGGSILAGNNRVIPEFSQIAYLLNQMKVITKKQLNDLLQKYLSIK